MKTSAGLWIDHREAIIVLLSPNGRATLRVKSLAEKQRRRTYEPDKGSFPAEDVPCDDVREREYQGELTRYYDKIISHLGTADEILVLGPGEAKIELIKRFIKANGTRPILTVETHDKMTEPQIAAHVRRHFHDLVPRLNINAPRGPLLQNRN